MLGVPFFFCSFTATHNMTKQTRRASHIHYKSVCEQRHVSSCSSPHLRGFQSRIPGQAVQVALFLVDTPTSKTKGNSRDACLTEPGPCNIRGLMLVAFSRLAWTEILRLRTWKGPDIRTTVLSSNCYWDSAQALPRALGGSKM